MEAQFFLRGIILGLSIAAPVGPIGVLCIRRTLAHGRLHGFISGIGAASADAIYGTIAAFGLTMVANILINYQDLLGLVGGCFLCFLGVRTLMEKPRALADEEIDNNMDHHPKNIFLADYTSTLFLTLTNPMTILAFAAIFAGFGLSSNGSAPLGAITLVAGVFLGSAAWWLFLSSVTHILRTRFISSIGLRWINRISGLIIIGFGLVALWW